MTSPSSQALADRLAELAGWTKDHDGWWTHPGKPYETTNTIVKVGSLDALERWRGEHLPGTMLSYLHDYSDQCGGVDPRFRCEASIVRLTDGKPDGCWIKEGRTMWYAYAAALVAAKESKNV